MFVCVCVCVCVSGVPRGLQVRFPVSSGGLYVSMSDTTEADPLGHNWYAFLTAELNLYILIHSKTTQRINFIYKCFSVGNKFGFLPNGIIQNQM